MSISIEMVGAGMVVRHRGREWRIADESELARIDDAQVRNELRRFMRWRGRLQRAEAEADAAAECQCLKRGS